MEKPLYKAFISYSHRDERWAKWLQRSLERYRVPRRLAGKPGAHGEVPSRLRPVFRDREDLSSASDLTGRIKEEIGRSEFLVVICSPASARSRWVDEEIRYFREQVGDGRVLALVVDGDPHADAGEDGCFPEALLLSPDGTRREPLAADVRRYADGKHLALLKIIAGLLGVRLDELRRRDAHRRLQQRVLWGVATVVLVSVLGWLLYSQAASRAAAQVQRANTEDLLSYMLGDLERLDPIAGVVSMAVEHDPYRQRVEQLGLQALDAEALLEKAMQWREAGGEYNWNGRLQPALEQFENSLAALIELHKREGSTDRVLFELGQAEFYVGEIYVQMGELDTAQEHWVRYGALTRRLLTRQPNNPTYVMELSYTLMNLGALEHMYSSPDSDKSLELLQAALQYNQIALVLSPENPEYRDSLPTQLAWLADTWVLKCSLGNALESRQEAVALRRELVAENPDKPYFRKTLGYALTGLAGVQSRIGLGLEAVASFEEMLAIMQSLHEAEPDNESIEWELLYRKFTFASHLASQGELERAAQMFASMAGRVRELSGNGETLGLERSIEAGLFELDYARILLALGETAAGEERLQSAVTKLAEQVRATPDVDESLHSLGDAVFFFWDHFGRYPPQAEGLLPDQFLPGPDVVENCGMADLAARLAVVDGDLPRARRYVDYALSKGFYKPDFVEFCKSYGLCD